ncbi:hypothetical protein [Marinospirillum alkaliphilum]|uniref:Uncharacterized protein n=1 Tax=Marinospirillum alkaliphilum DSM 21637 TaxID=1122209 RepID=A0A1K1UWA3_9GAMM|nr:hypothetical protein [Marinospirillum alkaliphilum]SFX17110.1 hypothetical protein SAMN02745752_00638 [Marinospirillum alkaliphilum DSM 21637]
MAWPGKHYDYNQMSMVVINYLEQIQPGTLEFALHYLIAEKLGLSAFHQPYKNDAEGRPAYDANGVCFKVLY